MRSDRNRAKQLGRRGRVCSRWKRIISSERPYMSVIVDVEKSHWRLACAREPILQEQFKDDESVDDRPSPPHHAGTSPTLTMTGGCSRDMILRTAAAPGTSSAPG